MSEEEKKCPLCYKAIEDNDHYMVGDHDCHDQCVTKAVEKVLPVHKAQLMSYMKLMDAPVGLLINFHEQRLVDGISRMILPGANT